MSITIEADGISQQRVTDTDTTGLDLFGDDRTIVAVRVNGELWDLQRMLPESAIVESVMISSQDGARYLAAFQCPRCRSGRSVAPCRRQAGHWPTYQRRLLLRLRRGTPFTPDDLREIGKAMIKIIKERQRFRRRTVSDEEARAELATEPYKLERSPAG